MQGKADKTVMMRWWGGDGMAACCPQLTVMAILDRPFFAMAMLVERSPIELPHASTVRPSTESGMDNNNP